MRKGIGALRRPKSAEDRHRAPTDLRDQTGCYSRKDVVRFNQELTFNVGVGIRHPNDVTICEWQHCLKAASIQL